MKSLLSSFVELIYPSPKECPLCGQEYETEYCRACVEQLKANCLHHCATCGRFFEEDSVRDWEETSICHFCQDEKPIFDGARSVNVYEGLLKEAIYIFKYTGKQSLAVPLARVMTEVVVAEDLFLPVDCIVPVPVHHSKLMERSFNQAELLSVNIGEIMGLYVVLECLKRIRPTPTLSKLSYRDRGKALTGAFVVANRDSVKDKNILLVDDIITTGATIRECSKELKSAGAARVYVITLAAGKIRKEN